MVIDTSALISIMKKEKGYENILDAMNGQVTYLSTANMQEAFMVAYSRKGDLGWQKIESLLDKLSTVIIPVDEEVVRLAMHAYANYGKGQGTKAGLNYGDCFAYATAKSLNVPLLFIGNDFSHTDIESVL